MKGHRIKAIGRRRAALTHADTQSGNYSEETEVRPSLLMWRRAGAEPSKINDSIQGRFRLRATFISQLLTEIYSSLKHPESQTWNGE